MKKNYLVKTLVALCATMVLLTTTSFMVLADPDTIVAWTDKDAYIPGEYVEITAKVTEGGVGVKDVYVCLEQVCSPLICLPGGLCLYTDINGEATFPYYLDPSEHVFPDEYGTWTAHVRADQYNLEAECYFEVAAISLIASTDQVPAQTGGSVTLSLDGGAAYANRGYAIFGGVTGTTPGTPLPKMGTTLPLNLDIFTDLVMSLWNTPVFANFLGKLDATGKATAYLNVPPLPDYVGLKMYYAATVYNPFNGVSNPIDVTLI